MMWIFFSKKNKPDAVINAAATVGGIYANNEYRAEFIFNNISIVHARSRAPAWSCLIATKITGRRFVTTFHGTYNNNKLKIEEMHES